MAGNENSGRKNMFEDPVQVHFYMERTDVEKLNDIANKLIEIHKTYNNVCLFIKPIDIEDSNIYTYEKIVNLINFSDTIVRLKGSEYINKNSFLLMFGGLTKKYSALIGRGADTAIKIAQHILQN